MSIPEDKIQQMFDMAKNAMQFSNITKSDWIFGAAILGGSGKIYSGVNFDGCPMDYCAERVALLKALSEGEKEIVTVLSTNEGSFESTKDLGGSCGICLNALYQLGGQNLDLPIYYRPTNEKTYQKATLGQFYPYPF